MIFSLSFGLGYFVFPFICFPLHFVLPFNKMLFAKNKTSTNFLKKKLKKQIQNQSFPHQGEAKLLKWSFVALAVGFSLLPSHAPWSFFGNCPWKQVGFLEDLFTSFFVTL